MLCVYKLYMRVFVCVRVGMFVNTMMVQVRVWTDGFKLCICADRMLLGSITRIGCMLLIVHEY